MHLSSLLYYEGTTRLAFEPNTVEGLEIWVFEKGLPVVRKVKVSPEDLEEWLQQTGKYELPQQVVERKTVGGVRLLVHKWRRPFDGHASGVLTMPFSRLSFAKVIGEFMLPRSVAADFAGETYVPTRFETVKASDGTTRIGIVQQSPLLFNIFTSIALSYNPATRMTSGLVRMMSESRSEDAHIGSLIPILTSSPEKAAHPLTLPSLAYGMWHDVLRIQHNSVHDSLTSVQFSTGLMRGYLRYSHDDPTVNTPAQDYGVIHAKIVTQHAFLSTALSDFVAALGEQLENAVFHLRKLDHNIQPSNFETLDEDLLSYISYFRSKVKTELQHRQTLLNKIQIQLQVVYNLMQQRNTQINQKIAIETKRDSSAMKSLALITMIFLPTTAIATIFSNSTFFSARGHEEQLQVNHVFWVFWAIAIPLTFLILLFFIGWMNRESIYAFRRTSGGFEHLRDDEERAMYAKTSKLSNTNGSKRTTSGSDRTHRFSVAEAEKWNTLQEILRDNPSTSNSRYYEAPIAQTKTGDNKTSGSQRLTIIQEDASMTSTSPTTATVTANSQISAEDSVTSNPSSHSAPKNRIIVKEPRPPVFQPGPREMVSSVGADEIALEGEYLNLLRYISTVRERYMSGRVHIGPDEVETSHNIITHSLPSSWRRWLRKDA